MPVGCRALDVIDDVQDAVIPVRVLYPTHAAARPTTFGPYTLEVAIDAPLDGEDHPVVIISHGKGGSPWLYRDLAAHLAGAGFVVALPQHPGNHRGDNSLDGTPANLENRPRHLRLVGDALEATRVAIIGHSMGGYTALAVAGGRPLALPGETHDGRAHPVPVLPDPRVRALVLLTPATLWFMAPGALADVAVPILMFTGERDSFAPAEFANIVVRGVAGPVDHRVIPNAGHFSFTSPVPPAMISPGFLPSQDPPGFDRVAFQPILHTAVTSFLRAHV